MTEIITIAFVAALLSLDITAFGQFMVSRPIVSATFVGYLLGDIKTGLWMGMTVELIWIGSIPMGAAIPLETTAVALLSVVWGLKVHPLDPAAMILALILSVPAGILFRRVDIFVRYLNVNVMHRVEKAVMAGNEKSIGLGIFTGLGLFFLKAFVLYLILIYPGQRVVDIVYHNLNGRVLDGLRLAWMLLPVLGMGLMLVNFRNGKFPCNKIEEIGRQKGLGL